MSIGVTVFAIAASSSAVPPVAAAQRTACDRAGKTLLANPLARVYRVGGRACAVLRGRQPIRLGPYGCISPDCASADMFRLVGRRVAYQVFTVNRYGGGTATVYVRDLRTGGRVHRWSTDNRLTYDARAGVSDLALGRGGAVAWIAHFSTGASTARYEVRKSDATGDAVLLDSGPAIASRSLAASGRTLFWTNDGQPRSADLR